MEKLLHPVSVRFPPDLYARLVEDARANERSISAQIIFLIRQAYAPAPREKETRPAEFSRV